MKTALVDTNILSLFFRGNPQVVEQFKTYLSHHDVIILSIITYYEIVSGLKHRDAHKQLGLFLDFAAQNAVLPLTQGVADAAAKYMLVCARRGNPSMILFS